MTTQPGCSAIHLRQLNRGHSPRASSLADELANDRENDVNRYIIWICLCIFGLSLMTEEASAAESPPNLVFIIADDCTFRDIGCYGGQAHTPNIDRLATEGMKFNRCFQTAPMCSPTRHNIYTGLYPVKSGAYPNHTFAKPGTKTD